MAESQREYIVGTVRPTNRPEAGQEIDLDEKIPAKIKLITRTMNFTRGTEEEFSSFDARLRSESGGAGKDERRFGAAERRAPLYVARLQGRAGDH